VRPIRTLILLVFLPLIFPGVGCLSRSGGNLPLQEAAPAPYISLNDDPAAEAWYFFSLANLLASEDRGEEALAALQDAVERDPRSEYLQLALAELALRLDQEELAFQAATTALELNPAAVDAHLLLGNIYSSRDDFAAAVEHLQAAHQLEPAKESLVLHLAIALTRNGELNQATELLQEFLKNHPDATMVELTLGRLYQEAKNPGLAEATYRRLLSRRPDLDAARIELGKLYEQLPDGLDRALEIYREALADNPGDLKLRHHLVALLVNAGRLDDARLELERILEISGNDLEAWRKLGLVNLEQERWEEAIAAFSQVLHQRPDFVPARFYLGVAQENQDELEAALENFAAVPAASPLADDALFHRAFLLQKLGRREQAIALLEERLTRPTDRPQVFEFLAALYGDDGASDQALATLERGLQAFPNHLGLHYSRAILLEKSGDRDRAAAAMEVLLKLDPNHAEALNYLAYLWAERGEQLERALDYARRALSLSDRPHIRDTLGWVYYQLGRFEEALRELQRAAEGLPDDPIVLEHLGDACRASHLYDLAALYYRQALDKTPENKALKDKLEKVVQELKR
jgi:tetratricopeptide (TPR) repeat protein